METLAGGWTRASEDQGWAWVGLDSGGLHSPEGEVGSLSDPREVDEEGQSRLHRQRLVTTAAPLTSPTTVLGLVEPRTQGDFSRHPTFTGMKNVTSAVSLPST